MAKRKVQKDGEEVEADIETTLQRDQVWEEAEHENPFEPIWRAKIIETRTNVSGVMYARFNAYRKDNPDIKEPIASLSEADFLARFSKKVFPV